MTRKRSDRSSASSASLLSKSIPLLTALAFSLGACSSLGMDSSSVSSALGDKKEEKLPGRRISILKSEEKEGINSAEVPGPINLPPAVTNASWSQPGGVPANAPGHLAFSGQLHTIWTVSAGEGSSKRMRLTAIPIVYGNKIFTLDAEGTVRALSAESGATIWKTSLVPGGKPFSMWNPFNTSNTARAGFGGGIAADGGKIFVASGFGTVVALDPDSGKVIWSKKLDIPIREAPTAADGRIYVVNSESEVFCLSTADGSELWSQRGLPENAAVLTSASPAVAGNLVFVPFPSGEIAALDVKNGQQKWTEALRQGDINSSSTAIGESSRPVVDRELVFAMSRGGQLIATSREKGERVWTRDIAGLQTPWVAGDALFVVDVTGKLVALNRKDGKVRWVTPLPNSGRWSGPVLAGGKLWLTSAKGLLLGVDATSGSIATQTDLSTPVLISPIVAEGRLYVLTDKAKLIAMN
jgi:outer membrane protein assembly factor BamB